MKINFSLAFVDLVFQILFGLMFVLSSMVPAESSLKIQSATIKDQGFGKESVPPAANNILIISVDQSGNIQVKGQDIKNLDDLESIIRNISPENYSAVSLRVDRRTPYEEFLRILHVIKKGPPTLQIDLKYLEKGE